ncbi:unnamed protein product [Closterium sp. Naga37s-1]|nr:unnamed protein product [Closterium sp. Naga37s-1]
MMARLHGRVVTRRSGLVFAAQAALMLSGVLSFSWLCAHLLSSTPPSSNSPPPHSPISQPHHSCAPRTAAVRLPAASNAPHHKRAVPSTLCSLRSIPLPVPFLSSFRDPFPPLSSYSLPSSSLSVPFASYSPDSCVQRRCGANAVCVKERGA